MQQIFLKDLLYSRHCAGLKDRNKQGRASALTGNTGAHSHNEATSDRTEAVRIQGWLFLKQTPPK